MNTALQTTCECPFSSATSKYLCLKYKFFCIWQQIKNTIDDSTIQLPIRRAELGLPGSLQPAHYNTCCPSIQAKTLACIFRFPVSLQVENETGISWISGKQVNLARYTYILENSLSKNYFPLAFPARISRILGWMFFREQGNRCTVCPYFESSGNYFPLHRK